MFEPHIGNGNPAVIERLKRIVAVALLASIFVFYGNEIWHSSEHPYQYQQHSRSGTALKKTETISADERLADYTLWLARLTGALVISTIGLWIATWRSSVMQSRDMKSSIAVAQQMADVADKQLSIIGLQTDIQKKQHAIGRLQFLATHRPRLRVRHVSVVDPGKKLGLETFFFDHGKEIKGGLVVVNIGGSKAIIIESRYRIYFSKDGLPIDAPYDETFHDLLLVGQELGTGESCAMPINDTIIMEPPPPGIDAELRKFESENWVIYVMGQIRYQDEGGAERFMFFCRERRPDGRFRAVDDPDYEYED